MKILFVSTEVQPFIKTGGLADVAYALPKALKAAGIDVRVILPKYGDISVDYTSRMRHLSSYGVNVGWRNQYCGLEYLEYEEVLYISLIMNIILKDPDVTDSMTMASGLHIFAELLWNQ